VKTLGKQSLLPHPKELALALRNRIAKAASIGATVVVAAMTAMASPASATGIVTPTTVQTSAVFSQSGAKAYEGDAGVVTITIPANTTFKAGQPLKWEECNLDPTSQNNCDGLTIQTFDPGTSGSVIPNADGSVTIEMDLWILPTGNDQTTPDVDDPANTNPNGFDPGSTVTCDNGSDSNPQPGQFNPSSGPDACSIWVGDSTAAWSSNSYVFNGVTPEPNLQALAAPTTTTTTVAPTTTTTVATTTTTVPSTTTTTTPSGGQVPESPYVPLLPLAAVGLAGGGLIALRIRRRRAANI
jgi:hypothetical protein